MILLTLILIVTLAYVGLIVAFTFGLRKVLKQELKGTKQLMPISVIVAFKDEALNLPTLLNVMMHQSFPKEKFELILVNDHSSDGSISIVEHYSSMCDNLRLVNLPENRSGKKSAIACGIDSAINPLIAITDADCEPSKDWLRAISLEARSGSVLILGPVIMAPVNSISKKLQAIEYSSLMASAAGSCGIGHPVIASSANLAFRNDLLNVSEDNLNPKVTSGDDMFLLHYVKSLHKSRISFLGNRAAIVKTSTMSTLPQAIIQRKRWASKSIFYSDVDTIITGFIVLLFNMALVFLMVSSVLRMENLYYFFMFIMIKSFVDFHLLHRYLSFVEQKELLKVFLPLQLVYPIYIVYAFFTGIINKVSWKGRPIN